MLVFNTTELDEVMSQRYMDKLQLRDCNGLPILTRLGLGEGGILHSFGSEEVFKVSSELAGLTTLVRSANGTAMHQILNLE